jgi:membrane protein implicated in regulation of membrane protease activity
VAVTVDPYAVLRPRRGRAVAIGFGIGSLVLFGVVAVLTGRSGVPGWGLTDSLLMFGVGVLIAAMMWRFASLRAVPSPSGLEVRNVLLTRRIAWDEVERVRFAGGDPWVLLDLTDGDQLAVMAVQRADGPYGQAEASRLAALVEAGRRRGAGRG